MSTIEAHVRSASWNRRTFLQGLGLGSLAGATTFGFDSRRAEAAGPPTRLAIMFTDHGVVEKTFYLTQPATTTGNGYSEFSLVDLPESAFAAGGLKALYRHRKKMIVIEGLSHYTAMFDGAGDDHAKGMIAALTANRGVNLPGGHADATTPSVDQIIGAELRKKTPSLTDLVNLVLADGDVPYPYHHNVYAQQGGAVAKVPLQGNVGTVYGKLMGAPTPAPGMLDPIEKNQGSVLDLVRSETARLAGRLDVEGKRRLDLHQTMIRDIESRITTLSAVNCPKSATPSTSTYLARVEAMMKAATIGFSCDLTRVANLRLLAMPNSYIGVTGDLHQDYAHQVGSGNAAAAAAMTKWDQANGDFVARWADMLDAIPNGAGGTMLDSTALVWLGELGNGGHAHAPIHMTILGGANGQFRTGRYVRQNLTITAGPRKLGAPHNKLLVSLINAMGLPEITSIGQKIQGTVDMTGPLPGLA